MTSEIKFLTSSNDYLEWFILFENEKKEKIFFDSDKIDSFSLSEMGYRMSDYFEFEDFKIVQHERKVSTLGGSERTELYFDDYKLFDLAEITILFSKDEKRQEVISRFNDIFYEEESNYQIIEHLITRKTGESLRTLMPILKDDNLKRKIGLYYELFGRNEFVNAAKLSAEIVNIVFSDYIKSNKLTVVADINKKLTQKLVNNSGDRTKKMVRLSGYIDDMLNISRKLSNDIYDIRHTEKTTIEPTNDHIYKLVSVHNISLVEMVLTSLKDDYVLGDNWEKIKNDYISKYKINTSERLVVKKPQRGQTVWPEIDDRPIDLSEIPF